MSNASELNQRIRIEKPITTSDGYGGAVPGWVEVASIFAAVEPMYVGQGERVEAGRRAGSAGYRVRIRARRDITAAMRIIWKTHTLSIHSIHDQGELLNLLTYEENQ